MSVDSTMPELDGVEETVATDADDSSPGSSTPIDAAEVGKSGILGKERGRGREPAALETDEPVIDKSKRPLNTRHCPSHQLAMCLLFPRASLLADQHAHLDQCRRERSMHPTPCTR